MNSFHQKAILQRVDCHLVYTEGQKHWYSQMSPNVFVLTDPPQTVATALRTAKSIYVHPDGFDYWIDILHVLHKQKELPVRLFLFAGSDLSITDEHIEFWTYIFPSAEFWIQNYIGQHPNCKIFPIGVNKPCEIQESTKKHPIVISYFNPNNSKEREQLQAYLDKEESLAVYRLPCQPIETYMNHIASAYFSVCPQGNGYDSYRFWESLSVGSIPLVLKSYFIESLLEQYPSLPFLVLHTWEDLPSFLTTDIPSLYQRIKESSNTDILTEEYWLIAFENTVQTSHERDLPNRKEEVSPSGMSVEKPREEFPRGECETVQTNPLQ